MELTLLKSTDCKEQNFTSSITTQSQSQNRKKVILKEKSTTHFIDMSSITHLVCNCYLTTVYTLDGQRYIVSKLLKEFDIELSDYGFIRIHRNTIVNSIHVSRYERGGNRQVYLSNKDCAKASRRGLTRLKLTLEQRTTTY